MGKRRRTNCPETEDNYSNRKAEKFGGLIPCLACASSSNSAAFENLDDEEERQELISVFKGLCLLFKINLASNKDLESEPAPLCTECIDELTNLLRVRKMLRECKKALTVGMREFKEKCAIAEETFLTGNIYGRDERYHLIRQQIIADSKNASLAVGDETLVPSSTSLPSKKRCLSSKLVPNTKENQAANVGSIHLLSSDKQKTELGVEPHAELLLANKIENSTNEAQSTRKNKKSKAELRYTTTPKPKVGVIKPGKQRCYSPNDNDSMKDLGSMTPGTSPKVKCEGSTTVSSSDDDVDYFTPKFARKSKKRKRPRLEVFCPICEKPFTQMHWMNVHKFTHYSKKDLAEARSRGEKIVTPRKLLKVECNKCGKILSRKHNLKSHMEVYHPPAKSHGERGEEEDEKTKACAFLCTICSKSFDRKCLLRNHQRTYHGNVKPFTCPKCPKVLLTQKGLTEHLLRHQDQRPFKCSLCSKAYLKPSHLQRHEATSHTKEYV